MYIVHNTYAHTYALTRFVAAITIGPQNIRLARSKQECERECKSFKSQIRSKYSTVDFMAKKREPPNIYTIVKIDFQLNGTWSVVVMQGNGKFT